MIESCISYNYYICHLGFRNHWGRTFLSDGFIIINLLREILMLCIYIYNIYITLIYLNKLIIIIITARCTMLFKQIYIYMYLFK